MYKKFSNYNNSNWKFSFSYENYQSFSFFICAVRKKTYGKIIIVFIFFSYDFISTNYNDDISRV